MLTFACLLNGEKRDLERISMKTVRLPQLSVEIDLMIIDGLWSRANLLII